MTVDIAKAKQKKASGREQRRFAHDDLASGDKSSQHCCRISPNPEEKLFIMNAHAASRFVTCKTRP